MNRPDYPIVNAFCKAAIILVAILIGLLLILALIK